MVSANPTADFKVNQLRLNNEGIGHVKRLEGLELTAYRDQAGVLTIGYGHTHSVTSGMQITEPEAEALLRKDVAWAENVVNSLVRVPLGQNQFNALVSWVFNVGPAAAKNSTLIRELNKGDYAVVPAQLARWKYVTDPSTGKKVVSNGLVNRRASEAGMWARGSAVPSRTETASEPPKAKGVLNGEALMANLSVGSQLLSQLSGVEGPMATAIAIVSVGAGFAVIVLIARKYWREG